MAVSWLAEAHVHGRGVARSSAAIALYREAGVSLYLYRGHRRFGANELYQCRRLSSAELEEWVRAIEALLAHLELRQGEEREAIVVAGPHGEGLGLAAVEELDPEALAAAQRLACKAIDAFGEAGVSALREASPRLTESLNLSTPCQSAGTHPSL